MLSADTLIVLELFSCHALQIRLSHYAHGMTNYLASISFYFCYHHPLSDSCIHSGGIEQTHFGTN